MPSENEMPHPELLQLIEDLKTRIQALPSSAKAALPAVGDVVFYRPLHQPHMRSAPVKEIIPAIPEPLVLLEDGKMMGISDVPYFLPAAAAAN